MAFKLINTQKKGNKPKKRKKRGRKHNKGEFYFSSFFGSKWIYNIEGIRIMIKKAVSAQQFLLKTQARGSSIQLGLDEYNLLMVGQNVSLFNFMNIPEDFPFDEEETSPNTQNGGENNQNQRANETRGDQQRRQNRKGKSSKNEPSEKLFDSLKADQDLSIQVEIDGWWANFEKGRKQKGRKSRRK